MQIPLNVTHHQWGDLAYYIIFLLGQLIYVLKRAGSAIRSKTNPIASRRAFIYANWDILLIRVIIEAVIFLVYRHADLNSAIAHFTSWSVPSWFTFPQGKAVSFFLGFFSDAIVDWIGATGKVPKWLMENIPNIVTLQSHTIQQSTDATGSPVTIESDIKIEKSPTPPPEKKDS